MKQEFKRIMNKGTIYQFLDTLPKDEKKQFDDQYRQFLMSELFQAIIAQDEQSIVKLSKEAGITPKQKHEVRIEIHDGSQNRSDKPTTKTTFSISNETLQLLEKKWFLLREKLASKRITKTLIVEIAIQIALDDYEHNGIKAKLYRKLQL